MWYSRCGNVVPPTPLSRTRTRTAFTYRFTMASYCNMASCLLAPSPADTPKRALDVGCAVGGAAFELARDFEEVRARALCAGVCVCVCVLGRVYVRAYARAHVCYVLCVYCARARACVCEWMCMCVYVCVVVCVCVYVCAVCVCLRVCISVCVRVCRCWYLVFCIVGHSACTKDNIMAWRAYHHRHLAIFNIGVESQACLTSCLCLALMSDPSYQPQGHRS